MNAIVTPKQGVQQDGKSWATNQVGVKQLPGLSDSSAITRPILTFNVFLLLVAGGAIAMPAEGAGPELALTPLDSASGQHEGLVSPGGRIWEGNVGDGFLSSVQTLGLETTTALGVQAFGGQQVHDIALFSLSYGHMLGNVVGGDHWYRGNWEARAELFSGAQFSPTADPLVGLTPHLRYNFATGARCVPYADLGAGVTASGIGAPDQSGTFEFNLQANIGAHWFVRDNLAVTVETGFLHFSCAGLHHPNLGVNTIKESIGLTWFF